MSIKEKNSLQIEEELVQKKYKDDWGLKSTDDKFVDNTFWKLPSQYQIDDLLGEQSTEAAAAKEGPSGNE